MPKSVAPLFAVTGLLLLIFHVIQKRPFPKLPLTLSVLFTAAIAWALVSSFWSIALDETLSLLLPLGATFLAGLVICSAAEDLHPNEFKTFSNLLIFGFFIGIAILIIEISTPLYLTQLLNSVILNRELEIIIAPRAGDPANYYKLGATVAVLLFWPCLVILWQRFGKYPALAFTLWSVSIFFFSGSLSAFVGQIIGIITAVGFLVFRGKAVKFFIFIIFVGTLAAPLIPQAVPDTRELSSNFPNLPDSIFPRTVIWKYTASAIGENPILGKGLDTARAISRNIKSIHFFGQKGGLRESPGIPLHPHNAVLQIWVELGLIGAIIFGLIMVTIIRGTNRLECSVPVHAAIIGLFFTTFFVANVSYGIWQSWWQGTIWLNAAFMIFIAKANKSNA